MITRKERINFLVKLATKLDKLGLHKLASQVDNVLKAETSHIETIITIYKDLHKIGKLSSEYKNKILTATLRKDDRPDTPQCPFGLPIPRACKYVGDAINEMSPRAVEHRHNRQIYNQKRTHSPCPFALQVMQKQKAVHCSFGTINAELPAWEQFSSSPYYPKLWQGFNVPDITLDTNYYNYHDFNYYSVY